MATFDVGKDVGKMVEEERQRRLTLYDEHRRHAWDQINDSTDNFDRNMLALSSGALALSIAFLKDVTHGEVVWMPFLIASWILFSLCIAITLGSFQLSILANKTQLEYYEKWYLKGQVEFKTKTNPYSVIVQCCTVASGITFLLALICTLAFCGHNLGKGGSRNMTEEKRAIVQPHELQRGQLPMDMTPTTIPTIPPPAPAEPTPSPSTPAVQPPAPTNQSTDK